MNTEPLRFENEGPYIRYTNFFQTDTAAKGGIYMTINAGAFRLLLPPSQKYILKEIPGTQIIVSRGPWREMNLEDGIEILFDDHSAAPFSVQLQISQCVPRPSVRESAGRFYKFLVYTQNAIPAYEGHAHFRGVPFIPWLKPL